MVLPVTEPERGLDVFCCSRFAKEVYQGGGDLSADLSGDLSGVGDP